MTQLGFRVIATGGTQRYLADAGLPVEQVNKVAEGRPHIVDKIVDGDVALIFNTTEGWQSLKDSQSIRATAVYTPKSSSPPRTSRQSRGRRAPCERAARALKLTHDY